MELTKPNKNATHPTTTDEKRAINSLKSVCNITILPADNGGAIVVLDTEEYKELQQLPDATAYAVLTSGPTPKQTRAIQNTLDKLVRDEALSQIAAHAISPKSTSIARANGLPEVHKPSNPLGMIASVSDSPSYKLSKWMFGHRWPLTAGSEHSMFNS